MSDLKRAPVKLGAFRRLTLRWKVAHQANRLPTSCWSDLVGWAMDGDGTRQTEDPDGDHSLAAAMRGADWCRRNTYRGACYCGKIRVPELDAACAGRGIRPILPDGVLPCSGVGGCGGAEHDVWCPAVRPVTP